VNIRLANEETDKQLDQLGNLSSEIHDWEIYLNIKEEIMNIKNCLPIIEEIANPAMRTRHWKNLVRISGSTALVDNETLKMLTFGQLIDLNLHLHVDEVKQIVQKAIKDLSIEQTIKTYEEIWLSKMFELKKYGQSSLDPAATGKPQSNEEDDARSSQQERRYVTKF
jgi:dynein heavy chain